MKLDYRRYLRWPGIVWVFLVLLLMAGIAYIQWDARVPKELVTEEKIQGITQPAAPDSLVVIVHGYTGDAASMRSVAQEVQNVRPKARIACLQYPAKRFSNADCFEISRRMCDMIQSLDQPGYGKIELVGYSAGALLLRKAYIYGWDKPRDFGPGGGPDATIDEKPYPREWVKKVDRFVLLAGMNRGWTTRPQSKGADLRELWDEFLASAGKIVGQMTGTARLIQQCEKGSPFVANLRMQWLALVRPEAEAGEKTPEGPVLAAEPNDALKTSEKQASGPKVIQLLGDIDNRVSEEDSRDISVSSKFVWVQLEATNHDNANELDPAKERDAKAQATIRKRAAKFAAAFGSDAEIEQLRLLSPAQPVEADLAITEAVIVLHGIRDRGGGWTAGFEEGLQSNFRQKHGATKKLLIYRPTYGYFPMGAFLLGIERQKNVRWFVDELTELKVKYPNLNARNIHFIGHSNGTYVLAEALKRYQMINIGRIVLAGSVLPTDFRWADPDLSGRYEKVCNYAGQKDVVVAWFPGLLENPLFRWMNKDIGKAGFAGFRRPPALPEEDWSKKVAQNQYRTGGHGDIIDQSKESIISFLTTGEPKPAHGTDAANEPGQGFFSDHPVLVWVFILLALILVGWIWCWALTRKFAELFQPKLARAAALVTYFALLFFLLQHV